MGGAPAGRSGPLRITGGAWKGRLLAAPRGEATRPTADRLRQAIFNILAARGMPIEGARVLDLFAGTGSLGLEALSRGAASATFVEAGRPALAALERNLAALGAGARADVVRDDWDRALARLAAAGATFDLVFLDPPYGQGLAAEATRRLAASAILAPGAAVVAEHGASDPVPERAGDLERVVERVHGATAVSVLRRPSPGRE